MSDSYRACRRDVETEKAALASLVITLPPSPLAADVVFAMAPG